MSIEGTFDVSSWWYSTGGGTRRVLVFPVVGVAVSEFFLYFGHDRLALAGHLVTLLACVFVPVFVEDVNIDVLQAYALVPLFRLVNLGMPMFVHDTLLWFPAIYAPLIPAAYLVSRNSSVVDVSLGWKVGLLGLPAAVVLGAGLGYVEYNIIHPDALVTSLSVTNVALVTVVMVGFVGFVEEFLFRGVLQDALTDAIGVWPGILFASVTFGVMHLGYGVPLELIYAASIGVLFGYIYHRTESLVLVATIHGVLNVFLFAIIPLAILQ